ncbi:phospholipase ABHD3 [Halyomorpha halys]|uniref:phospholipase ABHD3 n=1 Tax=Halyomorpha halys TaxID=286706 RepID=UPI0006D4CC25|nr:phospholipase ABHD3-like [Halyomorpha halys]XP_014271543.1 phospholipase ABHD3-like [Halyomorpha halys]
MEWLGSSINTLSSLPRWYLGSAMASCYVLYYLFEVVKKPILATNPKGKFYTFIEKNMPILKEKFWPTLWCIESRAQTILPLFVRISSIPAVAYKREILAMKDGGEICLDSLEPKEGLPPNAPTVIVLPGLTGSSKSDYIRGLALIAADVGIRFIVFNQRGSGIRLKTPRTYCAANYEDLIEVINHVKAKYKDSLLGAAGVSMGGLILGNYLSSAEGKKTPLSCAMLISVPWNVHVGIESLEKPVLNLLLNKRLASRLCNIIRRMYSVLEDSVKKEDDEILKSKTIREFDSKYTAKEFGYKDVIDYYDHASIHDKIHKVTIPVLCLNAADDPFQPLEGIPLDEAYRMDNLCIVLTSRGGHIGFLEGIFPLNKEQYMFRMFAEYFKTMLQEEGVKHFKKEDDVSK